MGMKYAKIIFSIWANCPWQIPDTFSVITYVGLPRRRSENNCRVSQVGLWVRKFSEIYSNVSGNLLITLNIPMSIQSAVSKSNIAKWCCKISMFLTNNFPNLYALTVCIMFRKHNLFLAGLPWISANSNEDCRRYNFQASANISGIFRKVSGNIKFPENFQPYQVGMSRPKSSITIL